MFYNLLDSFANNLKEQNDRDFELTKQINSLNRTLPPDTKNNLYNMFGKNNTK